MAPERILISTKSVFFSGSVDIRKSLDWQTSLTNSLQHLPVTILNPWRPDWDSSWKEDISNSQFREQVEWELDYMEKADIIATYFDPATKAPVTLLELGLFARDSRNVVCCPEGFWKRGNVQVVCKRYGIPCLDNLDELANTIIGKLGA